MIMQNAELSSRAGRSPTCQDPGTPNLDSRVPA